MTSLSLTCLYGMCTACRVNHGQNNVRPRRCAHWDLLYRLAANFGTWIYNLFMTADVKQILDTFLGSTNLHIQRGTRTTSGDPKRTIRPKRKQKSCAPQKSYNAFLQRSINGIIADSVCLTIQHLKPWSTIDRTNIGAVTKRNDLWGDHLLDTITSAPRS